MKIIVVEDDSFDLEFITSHLSNQFPDSEIETFETEESFRAAISEIRKNPPMVVIMDMMLRWTDDPRKELNGGTHFDGKFQQAGARCQELLASFPETAEVPIIFHSVRERGDALPDVRLPPHILFSTKSPEIFDFTRKVRSVIAAQQRLVGGPTLPTRAHNRAAQSTYDQILQVIKYMARTMELAPGAFAEMGEENLRTHFLVHLNGRFNGLASGETFNYKGKTDILIKAEGRNLFIAECKFWKGEKSFIDTIDQLLSYLSWHDTMAAVLVFNRNANFTEVIKTIDVAVPKHRQYKGSVRMGDESTFRYIFRHPADSERDLLIAVVAFNIPSKP